MIKSNYAYVIIHYIGMYNPTTTTYYIWDCDGWKSHVDGFLYDITCTDENWFKNQTLKHLPHKLRTFSIDSVYVVHSSRVHLNPDSFHSDYVCANYIYVLLCNVAVKHSIKAFIFECA